MDTRRKRKVLFELWTEDPNCCYCGKPTFLLFRGQYSPGQKRKHSVISHNLPQFPKDIRMMEATIEHVTSNHGGRKSSNLKLACKKCNNEKGQECDKKYGPNPPREYVKEHGL